MSAIEFNSGRVSGRMLESEKLHCKRNREFILLVEDLEECRAAVMDSSSHPSHLRSTVGFTSFNHS